MYKHMSMREGLAATAARGSIVLLACLQMLLHRLMQTSLLVHAFCCPAASVI